MSNANTSPGGLVNPSSEFQESTSTAAVATRDAASKTYVQKPHAAGMASSAMLQIDDSPRTFPRFGDLPPEIRCIIWALALPTRSVFPYWTKPAPQTSCSSHPRCKCCEAYNCRVPVYAPAVMHVCREARYETQKHTRPLCSWMVESDLPEHLVASWSRAQRRYFWENVLYGDEMVPVITWFNPKTDFIKLDLASLRHFTQVRGSYLQPRWRGLKYVAAGVCAGVACHRVNPNPVHYDACHILGPPNYNDVFMQAFDPEITLALYPNLFDNWNHPEQAFVFLRNGLQALIYGYLRPRKHFYFGIGGMPVFVLTEEGRQKAFREELFSGSGKETRIIPATNEILIRKYEALRHHCHQHIEPSRRDNFDQAVWSGKLDSWHDRNNPKFKNLDDAKYSQWISNRLFPSRENISDAQLFMLQLADFIMWDKGLGYGRGEEIMELDGRLKENHPLVQQLGLSLPDCTPVLIFAAEDRPLETDCSVLFNRLPQMRAKIPEEDSSHGRLFLRRHWNNLLKRWGRTM